MEEVQNEMRRANAGRHALAVRRAGEKAMKHPQLMDSNLLVPTDPKGLPRGSGNEAGMRRLIGRTQMKKMAEEESSSDSEMEREGGAKHMGRMLKEHLESLHGAGYVRRFAKAFHGGAGAPMGRDVDHARASAINMREVGGLGGQNVPRNASAAQAYGSPPQAPASFARNTVGMGMPEPSMEAARRRRVMKAGSDGHMNGAGRMIGAGVDTTSTNLPSASIGNGKAKRSSARGQAIARLMREQGMTLGEASRHLKQHGDN
jgi:hypothetical protein